MTLQTHCHEYAVFGARTGTAALEALGVTVHSADGCCGVAGNFGFEKGHYEVSMAVAENGLAPALRDDPQRTVITDGFSCAMAVEHLATVDDGLADARGVRGVHLAELLTDTTSHRPTPRRTEESPIMTAIATHQVPRRHLVDPHRPVHRR